VDLSAAPVVLLGEESVFGYRPKAADEVQESSIDLADLISPSLPALRVQGNRKVSGSSTEP
jgi:hypothetical protein